MDDTITTKLPTADEAAHAKRILQNSEYRTLLENQVAISLEYKQKIGTAKTSLKREIYQKKLEKNNLKVAKIANLINLTNKLYDAGWNGEM